MRPQRVVAVCARARVCVCVCVPVYPLCHKNYVSPCLAHSFPPVMRMTRVQFPDAGPLLLLFRYSPPWGGVIPLFFKIWNV